MQIVIYCEHIVNHIFIASRFVALRRDVWDKFCLLQPINFIGICPHNAIYGVRRFSFAAFKIS